MDDEADFILVDVRDEAQFTKEHLKGAINIAYRGANDETTKNKLLALPDNKLKIFYCDWGQDGESASSALILIEAGYKIENIKVIWKGYFRWLELGYPVTTEWNLWGLF